jgi:hypothetical protein
VEGFVEGRWDGGRKRDAVRGRVGGGKVGWWEGKRGGGRRGEEGKRGEDQVSGQERYKVLLTNILTESVGKIVLRQGTEG